MANCGASDAAVALDVAIEASLSTADPIGRFVIVNPRTCALEAEEDVARWADNNSGVPVPHDQISRLRVSNALKLFDSVVEIVGCGVGIRKSRMFINRVHQMRAVLSGMAAHFRIKRGRDYCEAVVGSQGAAGTSCVRCARRSPGACRRAFRRVLLGRADAQSQPAEQGCRHGFAENPYRPSLMQNGPSAVVTVVQVTDPAGGVGLILPVTVLARCCARRLRWLCAGLLSWRLSDGRWLRRGVPRCLLRG